MNKIVLKGADIVNSFCKYKDNPSMLFQEIRENVGAAVTRYLNSLMKMEMTIRLGRKPYERKAIETAVNYRNGCYERSFAIKGIGKLTLKIPRDRLGRFQTSVIPRYQRHEEELTAEITALFLAGLSTRNVSLIPEKLLGFPVSKGYVSQCNRQLTDAVEDWRNRSLAGNVIRFMYVDGVNFDVRTGDSVETIPVLVAIGVDTDGFKSVLGFQSGDKEFAGSWREFFKDLKRRGLDGSGVELGIMDGLPGLEKVFREEFVNADVQRCQVHAARNVLAKVPRKLKKEVADDLRSIFYASSKTKALEFLDQFRKSWTLVAPIAVKCLENCVESCLTYLKFDRSL